MKNVAFVFLFVVLRFVSSGAISAKDSPQSTSMIPRYDHVVIVIEENKDYDQVIGSKNAPYINMVLVKEGANLTQMFAEEHLAKVTTFGSFRAAIKMSDLTT